MKFDQDAVKLGYTNTSGPAKFVRYNRVAILPKLGYNELCPLKRRLAMTENLCYNLSFEIKKSSNILFAKNVNLF